MRHRATCHSIIHKSLACKGHAAEPTLCAPQCRDIQLECVCVAYGVRWFQDAFAALATAPALHAFEYSCQSGSNESSVPAEWVPKQDLPCDASTSVAAMLVPGGPARPRQVVATPTRSESSGSLPEASVQEGKEEEPAGGFQLAWCWCAQQELSKQQSLI